MAAIALRSPQYRSAVSDTGNPASAKLELTIDGTLRYTLVKSTTLNNKIQYLQNKCKKLENQLYALKGSSELLTLINKIPEEHEQEAIQTLDLFIKSWEWKNKTYA